MSEYLVEVDAIQNVDITTLTRSYMNILVCVK